MVLSLSSGATCRMCGAQLEPSNMSLLYMSSVMMRILGFFFKISAIFLSSSAVYTNPVGFEGEQNRNAFVSGVIFFLSISAVILKFVSSLHVTSTGFAPASSTIVG